jgi:hypothetical protein
MASQGHSTRKTRYKAGRPVQKRMNALFTNLNSAAPYGVTAGGVSSGQQP